MKTALTILRKDLRLELRTLETVPAMTLPSACGPVALAWMTLIGAPPLTTTVSGPLLENPAMNPIC